MKIDINIKNEINIKLEINIKILTQVKLLKTMLTFLSGILIKSITHFRFSTH